MDWIWYLFRFDGRINRALQWQAVLIIFCCMMFLAALTVLLGHPLRGPKSLDFDLNDVFRAVDPESYRALSATDLSDLLIRLVGTPLFLWVYFASSIKRLHDRNKSGWWMVPFFVLPGLYQQFENRMPGFYLPLLFDLLGIILWVWGFVEMYCLRGSPRTTRFGPDPLAENEEDAKPIPRGTKGWDQQSEIEMVPHKAGPPPVGRVKPGHE